jgi:predicted alpha/beta-hydrolase family hydrolase
MRVLLNVRLSVKIEEWTAAQPIDFGTREEVATYGLSKAIEIVWLEGGDHDLKPRKAVSGFTAADHLLTMSKRVAAWIEQLGGKRQR